MRTKRPDHPRRSGHRATRAAGIRLALTLALALPGAGPAWAQTGIQLPTLESYLRLDWTVEQSKKGPRISGYAYNERDMWASSIQLLVEALDASGQVTGSTSASLYGSVPPRNRTSFEVPAPPAGSSYRVTVRSVEWRGYGGGGG